MEHQLRPPRGFVDIFNPFSLKNLESHTVASKITRYLKLNNKVLIIVIVTLTLYIQYGFLY